MTDPLKPVRGAGGGPAAPKSRDATETLSSKAYYSALELLCEGPIEGFAVERGGEARKAILLDGAPLLSDADTSNFRDVYVSYRLGMPEQEPIEGFDGANYWVEVQQQLYAADAALTDGQVADDLNAYAMTELGFRTIEPPVVYDLDGSQVIYAPAYKPPDERTPAEAEALATKLHALRFPVNVNKSVTRRIDDKNVDSVNVVITVQEQYRANTKDGYNVGTELWFRIEHRTNMMGDLWLSEPGHEAIKLSGKARSPYQVMYKVPLQSAIGAVVWREVRVTKIRGFDSGKVVGEETYGGDAYLAGYTACVKSRLTYPNSAVVGLRISSEQFRNIPVRNYLLNLLKVPVPTNYTAPEPPALTGSGQLSRTPAGLYAGFWDGLFAGLAWTNNPAYCLRDLLLNKRYGLGEYLTEDMLDDAAIYQIGRYCDEMVPTGEFDLDNQPILEPRFTLNCLLSDRDQAFKVISDLCTVFRGAALWDGARLSFVQDRPSDVVMQYSPANVVDGIFEYNGSSLQNRHTAAVVGFLNPDEGYTSDYEYVEDVEAVAKYGVKKLDLTAFGCTSRSQATRVGRWALYSELYETEIVTFRVGLDSTLVRPGDVIRITDPMRISGFAAIAAGDTTDYQPADRLGGRLLRVYDTTTFVLDGAVDFPNFSGWNLSMLLPDGTIEDRAVTNASSDPGWVAVGSPFSVEPIPGTLWLAWKESSIEPFHGRVLSVSAETDGTYTITAHRHDPDKYTAVEQGLAIDPPNISDLPDPNYCPPPRNLRASGAVAPDGNGASKLRMEIDWDAPIDPNTVIRHYIVTYMTTTMTAPVVETTVGLGLDVTDLAVGTYDITCRAVNFAGVESATIFCTYDVTGKTKAPKPVKSFIARPGIRQIRLEWEFEPAETNISHVEIQQGKSPNFGDSHLLTNLARDITSYDHTDLDVLDRRHYWIRVVDKWLNGERETFLKSPWTYVTGDTSTDVDDFATIFENQWDESHIKSLLLQKIENPALVLLDMNNRLNWLANLTRDMKTRTDAVIEVEPETGTIRLKAMARVNEISAAVYTEMRARASEDAALVEKIDKLGATNQELAGALTDIKSVTLDKDTVEAIATQVAGVATSKLQASVQADMGTKLDNVSGKLSSQYVVRMQHITDQAGGPEMAAAGFGLSLQSEATPSGTKNLSQFAVLADNFFIAVPKTSPAQVDPDGKLVVHTTPVFGVTQIEGENTITLNADVVLAGDTVARSLALRTLVIGTTSDAVNGVIRSVNWIDNLPEGQGEGWKLTRDKAVFKSNAEFEGVLKGATGVFSGRLSATAIDAVSTLNIAGDAVTIPRTTVTASDITVTNQVNCGIAETTEILAINFDNDAVDTSGSPKPVVFIVGWTITPAISGGGDYTCRQLCVLDGVSIHGQNYFAIPNNSEPGTIPYWTFVTVPPGNHTISIRSNLYGDIVGGPRIQAGAKLYILGAKR